MVGNWDLKNALDPKPYEKPKSFFISIKVSVSKFDWLKYNLQSDPLAKKRN